MEGRLLDGQSARVRLVELRVTASALEVLDHDSGVLETWPLRDLTLDGHLVRHRRKPGLRLTVGQPETLKPLLASHRDPGRSWRGLVLGLVAAPAVVAGLWLAIPFVARVAVSLIPERWEADIGAHAVATLTQLWPQCRQEDGAQALRQLEARLTRAGIGRPRQVMVVRSALVNAFTLPGGYILMTSGMIRTAQSADQVAGVLAHEMGHVQHRHALAAAGRSIGVATLATLVLGDASGIAGTVGGALIGYSYSRPDEEVADVEAVRILNRAGIDPEGLASFFEVLEGQTWDPPALLSSHPPLDDRAQRVRAARTGETYSPALDSGPWRALQAMCGKRSG
jgi:predicted Zn-dependent protease